MINQHKSQFLNVYRKFKKAPLQITQSFKLLNEGGATIAVPLKSSHQTPIFTPADWKFDQPLHVRNDSIKQQIRWNKVSLVTPDEECFSACVAGEGMWEHAPPSHTHTLSPLPHHHRHSHIHVPHLSNLISGCVHAAVAFCMNYEPAHTFSGNTPSSSAGFINMETSQYSLLQYHHHQFKPG